MFAIKKLIVITLCLFSPLYAAESPHPSREWMAQEYAKGNKKQTEYFRYWLQKYEVPIQGQVISFGCGTGEIEYQLAQQAMSVHGIDASRNMIEYAQKQYPAQSNLSFQHCPVEDFQSDKLYNLAIVASCFHWFADKPEALKRISYSLNSQGTFFANIETSQNPEAFGVTVFNEMKKDVPLIGNLLAALPNPTGTSCPTPGELHIMLTKAGFTITKSVVETWDWTMSEKEWRQTQLPLLLSTPGAQKLINTTSDNWIAQKTANTAFSWCTLSEQEKKQHDAPFFPECNDPLVQKIRNNDFCRYLFNNFLNRCLQKFQKNEDGTYTWNYETTVYVCKKK